MVGRRSPGANPRASPNRRWRRRHGSAPTHSNHAVLDDFERFSQVDDVFSRSRWDAEIRSDASDRFYSTYRRPLTDWRAAPGFTQHDYALRNAAWHVTDIFAEMYEEDDPWKGLDETTLSTVGGFRDSLTGIDSTRDYEFRAVVRHPKVTLRGQTATLERRAQPSP